MSHVVHIEATNMAISSPGAYGLVLLVILSGLGIAWGAQTVASRGEPSGDVTVNWERMRVDDADVVRLWIRNTADRELHGSPRLLILNENGGVQQSFAFGPFVLELDPGESVYVDWTLGTINRCYYGTMDQGGAPTGMRYDCAAPISGAENASDASCYDCQYWSPPPLKGRFVLVGIFGEHADATVLELG